MTRLNRVKIPGTDALPRERRATVFAIDRPSQKTPSVRLWLGLLGAMSLPLALTGAQPERPGEQLWPAVMAGIKSAQALTAARVVTQITVFDGDEELLGTIESVEALSWSQGRPVWQNISKKSTGRPGFTMELALNIEKDPAGLLDGYSGWQPKTETRMEGKLFSVWEAHRPGDETDSARVFVDPRTTRPSRAEFTMPIHSNLGTRQVKLTVIFGPGPKDTWVPIQATIDQAGRLMFWKRHLVITKTFHEWVEHPDS